MKKYENFCKALANLQDIKNYNEPFDNVTTTGLVALYGICFEQSWKAMKEILEDQGFLEESLGSPRKVLQVAYRARMINDEELWVNALKARNNVAHAYNEAIALSIIKEAKAVYLEMFEDLKVTLENNWIY